MEKKIEIVEIPAKTSDAQLASGRPLRVAAYCRVSTNQESQQNSDQTQKNHYIEIMTANSNWVLAEIFADEGTTGTSTKKRTDFLRMIRW